MPKAFQPIGHGIREIHMRTREVEKKPDSSLLSQQDLSDLYASEPFCSCAFCNERTGFIWIPAFSAKARSLHLYVVVWKDGQRIKPRPMCGICFDDLANAGEVSFFGISHPLP